MRFPRKYQMGGEVAPQEPAQPSMEEQVGAYAQQIVQQLGAEGAMMLAQMIMEMVQQPEPQAEAAPEMSNGGQAPMFKRGGKTPKMQDKYKKGSKMSC